MWLYYLQDKTAKYINIKADKENKIYINIINYFKKFFEKLI